MADQPTVLPPDVASSGRTTPVETTPPPEAQRAAKSTPIARKTAGYTMYSTAEEQKMDLKHIELARETRGHYIGPMPVQTFLDDFLPWNEKTPKAFRDAKIPTRRLNLLKSVATASETNSYKQYIKAFSGWTNAAATKAAGTKKASYIKSPFRFEDTHSSRDMSCGGLSMDITMYGKPRVQRDGKRRVMDFYNSESFVEMKPNEFSDAFVDPPEPTVVPLHGNNEEAAPEDDDDDESDEADDDDDALGQVNEALYVAQVDGKQENTEVIAEPHQSIESTPPIMTTRYPFENGSRLGVKTRGQLAAYNAVTLAVQYRSHLFSTLICGNYARLMRWDRSCAIVSRRFDYTTAKGATTLFRFYQRFEQLTDVQRGLDPSMSIPTKAEGEAAKKEFSSYVTELWKGQTQSYFKKQEPVGYLSLLKMVFKGETYIIPAPVYHEGFLSPFCRSTRRCIAFRPRDKGVFFFKDYWREDSAITLKESEIYKRLAFHKIENVAEMAAGGDVDNLKTIGHQYAFEDWVSRATPIAIRQLYGHRIILVDIGRDLLTFDTAKSLVKCVADAMKAHQMAYEKAKILHRDISVGNILMRLRGGDRSIPASGFLIDWDHCVVLDLIPEDGSHEHRISRTGTWQFISAHLAENPGAEHTVLDDRESAFYVLAYVALRHLPHTLDPQDLSGLLGIFDDYVVQAGRPDKGGSRKVDALAGSRFAKVEFKLPVLTELIEYLNTVFAARYPKPARGRSFGAQRGRLAATAAQQAAEKMQREDLESLHDGSWLYETLAEAADGLTEPEDGQLDFVDHSMVKTTFPKANRKRRGEFFTDADYETDEERAFKRAKGLDGQASRVHTSEFGPSSLDVMEEST